MSRWPAERYFAAMQRGPDGEDELVALFAPDAVYLEPFGRTAHHGRAAIRAYLRASRTDAPPELRLTVDRVDVAGDEVEAHWTCESPIFARPARGRDRFTVRDGLIARLDSVLLEPPRIDERAAELQRLWIGPHERHDAPIALVDYDARWPDLYAHEAARIGAALGERALALAHVGSTAVPGLAAKPIIDIALAVSDPADEPAYVPDLEAAGYVLRVREPEWHEHRLLRGSDPAVNLHVFALGSPEIDRLTRFRDRLRSDPADRERYAAVKRELAARRWRYVQDYADAKSDVVEEILTRAGTGERPAG